MAARCPQGRSEALATALQWGATTVQNEGTLFSPNVSSVQVTMSATIDLARPLRDNDATTTAVEAGTRPRINARQHMPTYTKRRSG